MWQSGRAKEAATITTTTDTEAATPPEPVIVPSETIFMQIVEFLLDTKATPVNLQFYV